LVADEPEGKLIKIGAEWVDQEVVVDGNLVSSRKPDDIPAFNRAMIDLFGEARQQTRRTA